MTENETVQRNWRHTSHDPASLPGRGAVRRPHLLKPGQLVAVEEQEVGGGVEKRHHGHASEEGGRKLT